MLKQEKEFKDLDKFLAWYKSKCPAEIYLVKDQQRYDNAMNAITTICKFATESNPDGTSFTVSQDALLGTSLCVEIISNVVIFKNVRTIREVLSNINPDEIIIEFSTRIDGKASLGISFEDVYDLAPPQDSPFPEFEKGYGKPAHKKIMK